MPGLAASSVTGAELTAAVGASEPPKRDTPNRERPEAPGRTGVFAEDGDLETSTVSWGNACAALPSVKESLSSCCPRRGDKAETETEVGDEDEGWEDAEGENGVEKVAGAEVAENFDEVPAPSRLIGDSEFCGERLTSASVCEATEDGGKGSPTSLSREPSAASSSARDCSRALGEAAWCSKASWRFGMLCTGEKLVAACMSPTNDVESLLPKTLTDDVEMEDTGPDSLLRCDEESSPSFRGWLEKAEPEENPRTSPRELCAGADGPVLLLPSFSDGPFVDSCFEVSHDPFSAGFTKLRTRPRDGRGACGTTGEELSGTEPDSCEVLL